MTFRRSLRHRGMKYLLRPRRAVAQHTWFRHLHRWRYLTNRPINLQAGLAHAAGVLGLTGSSTSREEAPPAEELTPRFDPNDPADRRSITDYCHSDCDGAALSSSASADRVPAATMAHWIEYLKAVCPHGAARHPVPTSQTTSVIQRMRPKIKAALYRQHQRDVASVRGRHLQKGNPSFAGVRAVGTRGRRSSATRPRKNVSLPRQKT